jgi:hypothetical protein
MDVLLDPFKCEALVEKAIICGTIDLESWSPEKPLRSVRPVLVRGGAAYENSKSVVDSNVDYTTFTGLYETSTGPVLCFPTKCLASAMNPNKTNSSVFSSRDSYQRHLHRCTSSCPLIIKDCLRDHDVQQETIFASPR